MKVLDWFSLLCLAGVIISLVLIYGGEVFVNQTLGFIAGWLTMNEIRMRERFNDMNERFEDVKELIIAKFESMEKRIKNIERSAEKTEK